MSDPASLDPPGGDLPPALPDVAAAELALGLLDGEARAAATRRVLVEPGFAHAVERWRDHFATLFELWPDAAAPDVLAQVERSIERLAAPAATVTALPGRPRGNGWRALAAFSSAAAAALLAVLIARPAPAPVAVAAPAPTLAAAIAPSGGGTGRGRPVAALYDAHGGTIRLADAGIVSPGRSAQLWVIPAGGTPHALGLLRASGGTALAVSPADRMHLLAGATLAVSLEPFGGSPTGQPTGPVVASGALARV